MSNLEDRVKFLEDRLELQNLIHSYCIHIDAGDDVEAIVNCFTKDARLDLTGLGLSVLNGHQEIRDFFTSVLGSMKHNAHYSTNFYIHELAGDVARCQSYVYAVGKSHAGEDVLVYAKHEYDCQRTDEGWKISSFSEPYLVPPEGRDLPNFD